MDAEDLAIRFIGYDLLSSVARAVYDSLDRVMQLAEGSGSALSQSFITAGSNIGLVGGSLLAIAAAATAVFTALAVHAASFDSAMIRLYTQANISKDQIDVLKGAIYDLAPAVGIGPDALADSLFHISSALTSLPPNLQSTAGMIDILTNSSKLARMGNADLISTTNAMIAVLDSYRDKNVSASEAAATLNSIVGEGNVTMDQLAGAFRTSLVPIAAEAGVKIESLGAAFATLTDLGVSASSSATYLRSTILQIVNPSTAASTALQALGLSGDEVAQRMGTFNQVLQTAGVNQSQLAAELSRTGSLTDVIGMLRDRLIKAGLSGTDAMALLAKAFGGIRSGAGVISLVDNFDSLAKKEADATANASKFNEKWDYFQSHDPQQMINRLKSSFDTLVIVLGQAFVPLLMQVGNTIGPLIVYITNWVRTHQALIQQFGIIFVQATAFVGIVLLITGAVLALTGVIMAAGPTLGVVALVLAGMLTAGATIRPVLGQIAQNLQNAVGPARQLGGDINSLLIPAIKTIAAWFTTIVLAVTGALAPTLRFLHNHFDLVKGVLLGVAVVLGGMLVLGLIAATQAVIVFTVALLANPITWIIIGVILLVAAIYMLVTHWKEVHAWLLMVGGVISGFFLAAWGKVVGVIANVSAHIRSFITGVLAVAQHAWQEFSSRPIYWLTFLIAFVILWIARFVKMVETWVEGVIDKAIILGIKFLEAAEKWLYNLPGLILKYLLLALGAIGKWTVDSVNAIISWGEKSFDAFEKNLKKTPGQFTNWMGQVLTFMKGLPAQMEQIGKDIIDGLINGFWDLFGKAKGVIKQISDGIMDAWKAVNQSHSPSRRWNIEGGRPLMMGVEEGVIDYAPRLMRTINAILDPKSFLNTSAATQVGASLIPASSSSSSSAIDSATVEYRNRIESYLKKMSDNSDKQLTWNERVIAALKALNSGGSIGAYSASRSLGAQA